VAIVILQWSFCCGNFAIVIRMQTLCANFYCYIAWAFHHSVASIKALIETVISSAMKNRATFALGHQNISCL
jgi:hypothetical protein